MLIGVLLLWNTSVTNAYETTYNDYYEKVGYHKVAWGNYPQQNTLSSLSGKLLNIYPEVNRFMNPYIPNGTVNLGGLNADNTAINNSVVYDYNNAQIAAEHPIPTLSREAVIKNKYTGIIGLNPIAHYMYLGNLGNNSIGAMGYTVSSPYGRDQWGSWTYNPHYWGYAYFGITFAYFDVTDKWYFVNTWHKWFGTLDGTRGIDEVHPSEYTVTYTKYDIIPNTYTVRYETDTARGGLPDTWGKTAYTYDQTYDTDFKIQPYMFTAPTGWHFDHWHDYETGRDYYPNEVKKNLTSENGKTVVLEAVYSPNFYTVKYVDSLGKTAVYPLNSAVHNKSAYYQTPLIFSNHYYTMPCYFPSPKGYHFAYWKYNNIWGTEQHTGQNDEFWSLNKGSPTQSNCTSPLYTTTMTAMHKD